MHSPCVKTGSVNHVSLRSTNGRMSKCGRERGRFGRKPGLKGKPQVPVLMLSPVPCTFRINGGSSSSSKKDKDSPETAPGNQLEICQSWIATLYPAVVDFLKLHHTAPSWFLLVLHCWHPLYLKVRRVWFVLTPKSSISCLPPLQHPPKKVLGFHIHQP